MVVGDDQVDAQRGRIGRLVHRRDAVVHRDDEGIAFVVDLVDGPFGQAVAVPLPAGQHTFDAAAQALELLVQQGGRSHPVHVVIAVDDDGLALFQGAADAGHRLVHVLHLERVAEGVLPRQEGQGLLRLGHATGGQQPRQQGGLLHLGGQDPGAAGVVPFFAAEGSLLFQLAGPVLGDGLLQAGHRLPVQGAQLPRAAGHLAPSPVEKPSPVRPSLASIPSRAAISLDTSRAASPSRVS